MPLAAQIPRLFRTYLLETSWKTVEVSRKRFLLFQEVMGQCDTSAFLGITVQGIKSGDVFACKICMKYKCVTLENSKVLVCVS